MLRDAESATEMGRCSVNNTVMQEFAVCGMTAAENAGCVCVYEPREAPECADYACKRYGDVFCLLHIHCEIKKDSFILK